MVVFVHVLTLALRVALLMVVFMFGVNIGPGESLGLHLLKTFVDRLLFRLASRERADDQRRGCGQAEAQPGESRK